MSDAQISISSEASVVVQTIAFIRALRAAGHAADDILAGLDEAIENYAETIGVDSPAEERAYESRMGDDL